MIWSNLYYLYYFVFLFGVMLLFFTARTFSRTKQKINPLSRKGKIFSLTNIMKKIHTLIKVWRYYFLVGDEKNALRQTLLLLLIFFVLSIINDQYFSIPFAYFVPAFILGTIIFVWKLGQHRTRMIFETSFPEVIQVLSSATTSGAGILQALERCGKDVKGQLGQEFKFIHRRLAIGEDANSVFNETFTRWPFKEFYYFGTIMRINMEKGGQMKEVINRLGRVIADSRKMEQKKKAMTAEARMSAIIVACFPVAFFIFMKFSMPENFDFVIHTAKGRQVLYYVAGSELFGMGIIYWLMKKAN